MPQNALLVLRDVLFQYLGYLLSQFSVSSNSLDIFSSELIPSEAVSNYSYTGIGAVNQCFDRVFGCRENALYMVAIFVSGL